MSGILDSKSRVMDVVITEEGRRQMHNGNLKIEFASFTDCHTFYKADAVSGSADASKRIFLEAPTTLTQDQITFETDDSGHLMSYSNGAIQTDEDGTIYSGSSGVTLTQVSGKAAFASLADTILSSSLDSLKNLMTIGTKNPFDDDFFDIRYVTPSTHDNVTTDGTTSVVDHQTRGTLTNYSADVVDENSNGIGIQFTVEIPEGGKTGNPITNSARKIGYLNSMSPLFLDWRLAWIDNFKYLPPVNASTSDDWSVEVDNSDGVIALPTGDLGTVTSTGNIDASSTSFVSTYLNTHFVDDDGIPTGRINIGNYPKIANMIDITEGSSSTSGWSLMDTYLSGSGQSNDMSSTTCQFANILTQKKSKDNNLLIQMFEVPTCENKLLKLDIIDVPEYSIDNGDGTISNKKLFFAGKIFIDGFGSPSYVNLFTILMEK